MDGWVSVVEVDDYYDKELHMKVKERFMGGMISELDEDRSKEIHITDLSAECPRKVWYQKVYPQPVSDLDERSIKRMWRGRKLHETPLTDFHEFAIMYRFDDEPYGIIVGSVDEILDDMVIDKKFVGWIPNEIHPHYKRQVLYYIALLDKFGKKISKGAIYYIKMDVNMEDRLFVFDVSDEDKKKAYDEMMERAKYLRKCLVEHCLPEKKEGWICNYCPFKDKCKKDEL